MKQTKKLRRSGMTLMEIMVVIVIISIVTIAAGINVMRSLEIARRDDTKARARTIQQAAITFMMESSDRGCPTVEDLDADDLLDKTTERTDAWGHDFELSCEDGSVHVVSPGKDGELATDDDIQLVRLRR